MYRLYINNETSKQLSCQKPRYDSERLISRIGNRVFPWCVKLYEKVIAAIFGFLCLAVIYIFVAILNNGGKYEEICQFCDDKTDHPFWFKGGYVCPKCWRKYDLSYYYSGNYAKRSKVEIEEIHCDNKL